MVYPTLSLLMEEGAIAEAGGDGPRKAFALMAAGQAELAEKAEQSELPLDPLRALAAQAGDRQPAPIARAVGNLMTA